MVELCRIWVGKKTHERYNAIARIADRELEKADATRIDERCEGDDDKRAEVDYLEWVLGVEESQVVTPLISSSASWSLISKRRST